ncbi:MAG: hypothetical protein AB8A39_01085 [Prochlorococcus sp.]
MFRGQWRKSLHVGKEKNTLLNPNTFKFISGPCWPVGSVELVAACPLTGAASVGARLLCQGQYWALPGHGSIAAINSRAGVASPGALVQGLGLCIADDFSRANLASWMPMT